MPLNLALQASAVTLGSLRAVHLGTPSLTVAVVLLALLDFVLIHSFLLCNQPSSAAFPPATLASRLLLMINGNHTGNSVC